VDVAGLLQLLSENGIDVVVDGGWGLNPFGVKGLVGVEGIHKHPVLLGVQARGDTVSKLYNHLFVEANQAARIVKIAREGMVDTRTPVATTQPNGTFLAFWRPHCATSSQRLLGLGPDPVEDVAHQAKVIVILADHSLAREDSAARGNGDLLVPEKATVARVIPALKLGDYLGGEQVDVQGVAVPIGLLQTHSRMFVAGAPESQVLLVPHTTIL
jgi:hypothetical protein